MANFTGDLLLETGGVLELEKGQGALESEAAQIKTTAGDSIDYIFQYPDQGSFLRDQVVQFYATLPSGIPQGVQLLIYNPVESIRGDIPSVGNSLVSAPQLANSSVPLSGFWVMITVKTTTGALPTGLTNHPNIQIVNDRTAMFARKPSVLLNNIDITHINIVINIFGVYVSDGLQLLTPPLTNDNGTIFLLNDNSTLTLTAT